MNDPNAIALAAHERFASAARRLVVAWLALMGLLVVSYVVSVHATTFRLFNLSFAIAVVKALIVAWIFMELREASAIVRLTATIACVVLAVAASLSGLDIAWQRVEAAPVNGPGQIGARIHGER